MDGRTCPVVLGGWTDGVWQASSNRLRSPDGSAEKPRGCSCIICALELSSSEWVSDVSYGPGLKVPIFSTVVAASSQFQKYAENLLC